MNQSELGVKGMQPAPFRQKKMFVRQRLHKRGFSLTWSHSLKLHRKRYCFVTLLHGTDVSFY